MLGRIGVLDSSEVACIESGLEKIASEIEQGSFRFSIEQEDIHMAIESALIEHIGDVGKKLHTARSRNDQVALDCRMYVLDHAVLIAHKLLTLIQALLAIARKHTRTLMPGMTHLQHAQPINLGFHLVAWCESLRRDVERLESLHKRNNLMPLGSGALAGTPYNNDREWVSKQLGFAAPTRNAMDSVSDRDFALDLLYALAMLGMHISRIAEELVLWSSAEFGFMHLSDAYSTGSSIMPQKKNPDVPELLRGKSGRLYGNLIRLLVVMKSLTLSQNQRDLVKALAKTGKPVVLVLNQGRPRIVADIEPLAKAVVNILLPSNSGGDALANLLSGDANFSGRLPYSYPKEVHSLMNYDYKPSEHTGAPMEGAYNYNASVSFQWEFGYGLSYTTFEYSNLQVNRNQFTADDELLFTVDVKNTGDRVGKESVLLFSSDLVASLTPDNRRLRQFEKIELQPGETKTVTLKLQGSDLAFVGADGKWRLEEGDFRIQVGNQVLGIACTQTKVWDTPNR